MQLDPQSIVDSSGNPDPSSPLLKITGLSATEATVDQVIALDAATDFVNANNGANADVSLTYTFASGETFTNIIVDGAELALSANATNSPSPGTISILDNAGTILDSAALFGTGGALNGVSSVTAGNAHMDELADLVGAPHVQSISIESSILNAVESGSEKISVSEAIAAQDTKVVNSPASYGIVDTATEVSAELTALNGLSVTPGSLSVEDATISQYENLSSESLVTTINLETSFSDLNAASGTLTLSSLQGGTVTKLVTYP